VIPRVVTASARITHDPEIGSDADPLAGSGVAKPRRDEKSGRHELDRDWNWR
jgi:hypothetical protein